MKKTVKTKKTIESTKPVFTVDITECSTINDVQLEFALAKTKAGIKPTSKEVTQIIAAIAHEYMLTVLTAMIGDNDGVIVTSNFDILPIEKCSDSDAEELLCSMYKKTRPNIFKRFWNWITRKK